MLRNDSLIFVGDLKNFSLEVTKDIRVGLFNNKIVPLYKDEVIEEITSLDAINYIVTRGFDCKDEIYTKITLYREINGEIKKIVPTVKQLIEPLAQIPESAIPMIKQINWNLEAGKDFDILKLYKSHHIESSLFNAMGTISFSRQFEIHIYILYVVIKEYMATEDIRYSNKSHLGRYLFQIVTLKYLKGKDDLDSLLYRHGVYC